MDRSGAGPWWTDHHVHGSGSPELSLADARATVACREGGNVNGATRHDWGTAHRSLDGGEEVAHRWQDFSSKRLWHVRE
jgi:hypothetical protein